MAALCARDGCVNPSRARGLCHNHYDYAHKHGAFDTGPLVCNCAAPAPTPSDMCAVCYRVIAHLVHQRRATM